MAGGETHTPARNAPALLGREFPKLLYVVVEGIDQVGKTTVAEQLKKIGYVRIHSAYTPNRKEVYQHYKTLIHTSPAPVVFDRTFISEVAYGRAMRKHSRISDGEFQELLALLATNNCIILYLKETRGIMQARLEESTATHVRVLQHLDELTLEYDRCMDIAARYLPVCEFSPTTMKRPLLSSISEAIAL
jgi:thymidylate kinase